MMERSNVSVIAVAWFRPEEWPDLKRLCPDLQDTYQEWLANAEAGIEALGSPLKEQVVKIILTVDELRQWKRATGRKVDSKVRSNLAAKAGAKNNRTSH
jgi:hypothetical protein